MRSIRPLDRPTIRELSNFLLSPQTPTRSTRCISKLSREARHPIELSHRRLPACGTRSFTASASISGSPKPQSRDRGPPSKEDTQTDFGAMNVLGNTPAPSTSIDACLWDGFHLNSGVKITGGTGVLLVAGEAFSWRPWMAGKADMKLVNGRGQWEVEDESWGLLGLVWPKPGRLLWI
jgi:NADH dehydrogenase [ubiquinone] 1 alpha subcomplex assembly factor 3